MVTDRVKLATFAPDDYRGRYNYMIGYVGQTAVNADAPTRRSLARVLDAMGEAAEVSRLAALFPSEALP
jgi:hypothetical protein